MLYCRGITLSAPVRKLLNKLCRVAKDRFKYTGKIGLIFLTSEKMTELNKSYRQKIYTPDVLTFCYNDEEVLGEIVINRNLILKSKKLNLTLLLKLFVHGLVHLSNLDHEGSDLSAQEFFKNEREIMSLLKKELRKSPKIWLTYNIDFYNLDLSLN